MNRPDVFKVFEGLESQKAAMDLLMKDFNVNISVDVHIYMYLREALHHVEQAMRNLETAYCNEKLRGDQ